MTSDARVYRCLCGSWRYFRRPCLPCAELETRRVAS